MPKFLVAKYSDVPDITYTEHKCIEASHIGEALTIYGAIIKNMSVECACLAQQYGSDVQVHSKNHLHKDELEKFRKEIPTNN